MVCLGTVVVDTDGETDRSGIMGTVETTVLSETRDGDGDISERPSNNGSVMVY